MQAALADLEQIYQPGYRYMKAGVHLLGLVSPGQVQADLFAPAPAPRPRSAELMATLDKINGQMGRGTVRLAAVPYEAGWGMKQQLKSPGYVSRWTDLRTVT